MCNCWQDSPQILFWWAEDKSKWRKADHGLRRWTIWCTSQGMSYFMSKEVFIWLALSESPLMGKQTGNSWTTLWISCRNNMIHLSLVSFDPLECCYYLSVDVWLSGLLCAVSTSVWLCSSDYMECWLFSFGSLDSRIAEHGNLIGDWIRGPHRTTVIFTTIRTLISRGKPYLMACGKIIQISEFQFLVIYSTFSSQMIFVSNFANLISAQKLWLLPLFSIYLFLGKIKQDSHHLEVCKVKLNALVWFQ